MLDVGVETTACLKDPSVLLLAIARHLLNAWKEKLSVTWDHMLDVGVETTVCLRDPSVLLLAIAQHLFNAWKEKFSVTLELMLDVGWETTVCLRDQFVLLSVIPHIQQNVMEGISDVTWEPLLRDAGWETSVLLQGLSVQRCNKQMNIISSKFNVIL